jgi:uncharacterized protein YcbK (DUF882 family)
MRFSLREHAAVMLTPSFAVREFACKDGSDEILIDVQLLGILQHLRQHFAQPITIMSAYRTAEHNKAVGGSPNSQHLLGRAVDIQIRNVPPAKAYEYLHTVLGWHGGLGRYPTFTHIDVRSGGPVRW